MRNLYIVGDSFSSFYSGQNAWPLWTDQIGHHFSANVVNASMEGTNQDWQWRHIENFIKQEITEEDQLLVVLTSPMRFWFIEDLPQYSNPARATNLDKMIESSDMRSSIKGFLGNIWRPSLALQHQNQRLAQLSYWIRSKSLRAPLIIPAFLNFIDQKDWPELLIAKGNLYDDLQTVEFQGAEDQTPLDLWAGIECRYNHLCKQNHRVLADAVIHSLESNQQLDLTTVAVSRSLITADNCRDQQFAEQELCIEQFQLMLSETRSLPLRIKARVKELFQPNAVKKTVLVAGGGTAGLISALIIKKQHPEISVTMIESDRVGIVGVGEGSTEHWRWFMDVLGITTEQIIQRTGATFKFGINFLDWRAPGHRFMHVVSEAHKIDTAQGPEMIYSWLLDQGADHMSLVPYHCQNNLHRWPFTDTQQFHFDTFKLNEFLHELANDLGITVIKGDIQRVDTTESRVTALHLEHGQSVGADYYIDCTGFQRLICKRALGSDWISYSQWLPVDRAIAWPMQHTEPLSTWTTSRAMQSGWLWQIPVQARTGNGYVFSSQHTDADQAIAEVEQLLGRPIEKIARDISFEAGRLQQAVFHNAAAVGLSSGFIEPLEASSIGMTIQQARWISENLEKLSHSDDRTIDRANSHWQQLQENALDFVALHYQTDRRDTEFWQQTQQTARSPGLADLMEKFSQRLPHHTDFPNRDCLFREHNWLMVMSGLGLINKSQASKTLELQAAQFREQARERLLLLDQLVTKERNEYRSHEAVIEYFLRDSP